MYCQGSTYDGEVLISDFGRSVLLSPLFPLVKEEYPDRKLHFLSKTEKRKLPRKIHHYDSLSRLSEVPTRLYTKNGCY